MQKNSDMVLRSTKMCKFHAYGLCTKGDSCSFAHNRSDVHSRSKLQKTNWDTEDQASSKQGRAQSDSSSAQSDSSKSGSSVSENKLQLDERQPGSKGAAASSEHHVFDDSSENESDHSGQVTDTQKATGAISIVTWSAGSELHDVGQCKPCAYHNREKGCSKAAQCPYCHLCVAGEMKNRRRDKTAALKAERQSSGRKDSRRRGRLRGAPGQHATKGHQANRQTDCGPTSKPTAVALPVGQVQHGQAKLAQSEPADQN